MLFLYAITPKIWLAALKKAQAVNSISQLLPAGGRISYACSSFLTYPDGGEHMAPCPGIAGLTFAFLRNYKPELHLRKELRVGRVKKVLPPGH